MWNPILYPVQEDSGITLIGDQIKLKSLLKLKRSASQVNPYTFYFPANPGSDNQALFWSGSETTFRGIAIADVASLQTSLNTINSTLNSLGAASTKNTGTTNGTVPLIGAGDKLSSALIPDINGTISDSFTINSDAANTGSDRGLILARSATQSASYSLVFPSALGSVNQSLIINSISGSSANLSWGSAGSIFSDIVSHSTASININLANGNMIAIALNQNTTITSITGVPSGKGAEFTIICTQDATGNRTLTFPGGVLVTNSISATANSTSIIKVFSFNGGTSWEAIVIKPMPNAVTQNLWTFANLSSSIWLDFGDSSTISLGSGISQVTDKSGNAHTFTQSTASAQPALTANAINGKSAATFDGSNDYLRCIDSTNYGSNLTFFFVAKFSSANKYGLFDSAPSQVNVLRNIETGFFEWWDKDPKCSFSVDTEWHLITIVYSLIPSRKIECWIDDSIYTSATSSSTISAAWGQFSLGVINGSFPVFTGSIAQFVLCNRVLSDSDRNKMNGYAAYLSGLQSLLPSNHPYKSSPPAT